MALTFRFAQEADAPLILRFIRELADYAAGYGMTTTL